MTCPNCGQANPPGKKFCSNCGTKLAMACPNCGAALEGTERFCGECGTPVEPEAATGPSISASGNGPAAAPASERRLVSVLFADLVGFTSLSEQRDAEEVRELLTRYFDTTRQIIVRYGGTVEKFIGDAVMAVWGAPVAQEDDAERAVRAALELTQAVSDLGAEVGAPELRARAGVLTGEAAVTIGAQGQGMVAGDMVNTASRIQSAAEPGTVLVGEATRRATEAAIVYEDAGAHELKGKAEPVPLYRALRVVAAVGGGQKSAGLEAPFVGRDRELRLVKELFHGSADEVRAHLVSITGAAGIGKSRLSWEFFKYVDGLANNVRWHRGRCLSYGDGVTYWALAEMVRTRAGITEGEEAQAALAKLRSALDHNVPDPEERRWVEPRLAHLLGLEEQAIGDREDLFAAWRLFYERLAEEMPTVMVFEDCQWADQALLDFVEYLLEWSRSHRLFIVTLARPEMARRRPNWGTGRSATSLYLEPLPTEAMGKLLEGLVPGLPEELRTRILDRAEGVPLYAVETVRMLLDRGLLVQEGNAYRPAGPVEALEVPETLQALLAARLDGLTQDERRLVQTASVLGKTFTRSALAAVSRLPEADLDSLLSSLIRKEVLSVQADPRSPEHGQYGFLQDLLRHVAYETLSRKERKATHLAMAHHFETGWGAEEDEIIEVLASHYLDAYGAMPDAPDAAEIKAKAGETLVRAGERARSLAASEEAQRYFEQAAELAAGDVRRASLLERAGQMAWMGGRGEQAQTHFQAAMNLFEAAGETHQAARVSARLAEVDWKSGRLDEGIDRMEKAFAVLSGDEPDEDLARLAAQLGRLLYFRGDNDAAYERIEVALQIAETLWLPEIIAEALNTKALFVMWKARLEEAVALLKHSLDVALENDIPSAALRSYGNLADMLQRRDRHDEALDLYDDGLALARKVGNRIWEWQIISNSMNPLYYTGRWEVALERAGQIPDEQRAEAWLTSFISGLLSVLVHRGEIGSARELLSLFDQAEGSADLQDRAGFLTARAMLHLAEGAPAEAIVSAREALDFVPQIGLGSEDVKTAFGVGVEAALELGDVPAAEELLTLVDRRAPGEVPPFLRAATSRFRGRIAAIAGHVDTASSQFKAAAGMFRELGMPFWLAVTLLDHGEWLTGSGRGEEAGELLDEARMIFERLEAQPWLDRLERLPATATAGRGTGP